MGACRRPSRKSAAIPRCVFPMGRRHSVPRHSVASTRRDVLGDALLRAEGYLSVQLVAASGHEGAGLSSTARGEQCKPDPRMVDPCVLVDKFCRSWCVSRATYCYIV